MTNDIERLTKEHILAKERMALKRWNVGDPSGFLEISNSDVTYIDPYVDKRLEGYDALKSLYEGLRGKIIVDVSEMIETRVDLYNDIAILTYKLFSSTSQGETYWYCTEVYRLIDNENWRIIHTHWSIAK